MDEEMKALQRKIKEANPSWHERVRTELNDIQYDNDADILYVAYGEPTEAFSWLIGDPDDNVYLRVDTETYQIVGIDIMGFRRNFLSRHQDGKEVFAPLFQMFGTSDWRFLLRIPSEGEEAYAVLLRPGSHPSLEYIPSYVHKAAPELATA